MGDRMRVVEVSKVTQAVKEACIEMNFLIDSELLKSFESALQTEVSEIGQSILVDLIENSEVARTYKAPICQDTGMIVAFVKIGQNVRIEGGLLSDAIQEGIRQGYEDGYLRKSIVSDPILRKNTNDNTPGIIYYDLVAEDVFEIELAAKGFGSENMSRSAMLKPSDGIEGIVNFVIDTVEKAGSNPCPPIILGIGIGGTLDKAAQLAKYALLRPLNEPATKAHIAELENRLLNAINNLGIGPQGLGGTTTALAVHIEVFPTHIAGLPVVVNINCHASRHKKVVL
jgi:fumarate hydratase subunit alpha